VSDCHQEKKKKGVDASKKFGRYLAPTLQKKGEKEKKLGLEITHSIEGRQSPADRMTAPRREKKTIYSFPGKRKIPAPAVWIIRVG